MFKKVIFLPEARGAKQLIKSSSPVRLIKAGAGGNEEELFVCVCVSVGGGMVIF